MIAGIDWVTADHDPGAGGREHEPRRPHRRRWTRPSRTRSPTASRTPIAAGNGNISGCRERLHHLAGQGPDGAHGERDRARTTAGIVRQLRDLRRPVRARRLDHVGVGNGRRGDDTMSGTSMATPHVAGVAATYLETNPAATPAEVSATIASSATQGVVASAGSGSPNRLLSRDSPRPHRRRLRPPPPPPGTIILSATGQTLLRNGSASSPSTWTGATSQYRRASTATAPRSAPRPTTGSTVDVVVTSGGTFTYKVCE